MNAIERRLRALEQRAVAASPSTSAPFWSAVHNCMMENHGGLILPVVLAPEEWEKVAREHQDRLTRHLQGP